jgi:hypothetical protein
MIEDDRMAVWQAKYDSTLEAYTQGSKRIKLGSTPLLRKF